MNQKKNCLKLVENILTEIRDLPRGPFWVRDVVMEQQYPFPVTLDVGNRRHIAINPEIDRTIGSLSEAVLGTFFQPQKSNFTSPEWNKMVKLVFGSALVNADDEVTVDRESENILKAVIDKLRGRIENISGRQHVFGCHFCNISDLAGC